MSLPQRSRYPRPLKATHTFPGGNLGPGGVGSQLTGATSGSASPPNCVTGPGTGGGGGGWASLGVARTGLSSPPPVNNGGSGPRRSGRVYSLEDSPVTPSYRGEWFSVGVCFCVKDEDIVRIPLLYACQPKLRACPVNTNSVYENSLMASHVSVFEAMLCF